MTEARARDKLAEGPQRAQESMRDTPGQAGRVPGSQFGDRPRPNRVCDVGKSLELL